MSNLTAQGPPLPSSSQPSATTPAPQVPKPSASVPQAQAQQPQKVLTPQWFKDSDVQQGTYVIILGTLGVGKSSLAAQWPEPLALVDPSDTGLLRLRERKLIPVFPIQVCRSFQDFINGMNSFVKEKHRYKSLILEGFFGIFDLAKSVAYPRVDGDPEAFGRGVKEIGNNEWVLLVSLINKIIAAGFNIVITGHVRDKTKENAIGPNYTVETVHLPDALWTAAARNAEAVLCIRNVPTVTTEDGQKKGKPKELFRHVFVNPIPGLEVAKNQWGITEESLPLTSPETTFSVFKKRGFNVRS